MWVYFVLGFSALVLLWAVVTYNGFVSLGRLIDEAWSGVRVQLKRRHDLTPNLVAVVKGYAAHEKTLFEDISRLRAAAQSGTDELAAESALGRALGKLFAVAEAYPELRSNENFLSLQQSLQAIEDQLQMARRYYNGTVRSYMTRKETFPSLIIGNLFNFPGRPFFELDDAVEAAAPTVTL